jgi:hypothetical protein
MGWTFTEQMDKYENKGEDTSALLCVPFFLENAFSEWTQSLLSGAYCQSSFLLFTFDF